MNVLFIMCDQLRWDYLSCYGHPHLKTPNIDRLAEMGVRFTNAYVQAPVCGPSRASFLTGRYMSSHGCSANSDSPRPDEKLMPHYMRELGLRAAVVGKSSVRYRSDVLDRLGIDKMSEVGQDLITGGFEEVWRDDGLHPDPIAQFDSVYNRYLRAQGYDHPNPWDRHANSAIDDEGNVLSGWQMRHAHRPADIEECHSETAFTTDEAIRFIEEVTGDQPWCLHVSYIKPHWPYVAPAPYHNMYGPEEVIPAQKDPAEREDPHPVVAAFMKQIVSQSFSDDEKRAHVIPAYMGLVKQIDDHIGRLLAYLEQNDLLKETLIAFTSDHGDYLGDHYLGEKYLFHDASVKVPMIVVDPSPQADKTRGTGDDRFVESIDLLPTFIEFAGGMYDDARLEGCSLLDLTRQRETPWREVAISELDYSDSGCREPLGLEPHDCRAYMLRKREWKYIFYEGFDPQLFNLKDDPGEYNDLGRDPAFDALRAELHEDLFRWLRRRKIRPNVPVAEILAMTPRSEEKQGLFIGHW